MNNNVNRTPSFALAVGGIVIGCIIGMCVLSLTGCRMHYEAKNTERGPEVLDIGSGFDSGPNPCDKCAPTTGAPAK